MLPTPSPRIPRRSRYKSAPNSSRPDEAASPQKEQQRRTISLGFLRRAEGRLVALLTDWRSHSLSVHVVYPHRPLLSAKVRSFVDFLAQRFGPTPPISSADLCAPKFFSCLCRSSSTTKARGAHSSSATRAPVAARQRSCIREPGTAMSEEHDRAQFKAWLHPPITAYYIKTVCVTGRRRKDPHALGSGGDADTASCRSWPAISAKSGAPIGCCCCLASHRL